MVTCSPHSFRQYLSDMRNLHVSLKIGGEGCADASQDNQDNFEQLTRSPRRMEGETPRQRLLRRQQRLKKGWQDGDVVGSFVLPDLKLNARGDYVSEGRILDSSGDMVGSVVVTMVFLEGTLEDFQQIKIQSEEVVSPQPTISPEKMDNGTGKPRVSSIPVPESRLGKTQKTPTQEGVEKENQAPYRRRTSSFNRSRGREGSALQENVSLRRTSYHESHLQQPSYSHSVEENVSIKHAEMMRQQDSSHMRSQDGKNMEVGRSPQLPHRAIPQKVTSKNSQVVEDIIPVVRRERKPQEGILDRARPASWGLYSLLNGADPHSLVDSGAVRAEELPILLKVLEGHSPNIDLSNFDPKTQKLLDGLDLSFASNGINGSSPGKFTFDTKESSSKNRDHAFSVFHKGRQNNEGEPCGVSGVWPLEESKP
ncbi:hypothetical protein O3P69_010125, partial [Scylla paramamosain]